MARTAPPKTPDTATYTVLRALCMHGVRIEVGDPVDMTRLQYTEAFAAGKVGPYVAKPAAPKSAKSTKQTNPPEETTP